MAITANLNQSIYGIPFSGVYFRIVTAAVVRQVHSKPVMSEDGVLQGQEIYPERRVMIDVVGYATKPTTEDVHGVTLRKYNALYDDVEAGAGSDFLSKCYEWVMAQVDMQGAISA